MASATQERPTLIQRVEESFKRPNPMLHVPSCDNLAHMGAHETDTSAHGGVKDVTRPGQPDSRTKPMRLTQQLGGFPLIWNSVLNRGTNFTLDERQERGMEGLLPPAHESIQLQAERVVRQMREDCPTPISKYELLSQLAATNSTLLYYVLIHNLVECAPIVYTPTVGEACIKFDRIYRQALGMYFDGFNQRGRFRKILNNWPSHNVQIIVVTDGGRILGLGDLGTNGMGIPIGKIQLYVAGGGFHPEHSMPCLLDLGTNRKELLDDKFYMGNKKPRLDGEEHMAAVEEFCMAVKDKWPHCLIQFEDFQSDKAFAILERMRNKVLCFNDDIQGTGAIVTVGFINGMKAQGTELKDARVVFYGAGSSAVGVATTIASLLVKEAGLTKEEALKAIYMVDTKGLITVTRGDKLAEHKVAIARRDGTPDMKSLKDIVAYVKPHALIGLSGAGPAFTQDIIEELCSNHPMPLIFPLSNPTSQSEISAVDAYTWSKGQCIFASGSPYDPVEVDGKRYEPGQANNVFIFPGVGFGSVMVKAKTVTDSMFLAAARAVADAVPKEHFAKGKIYPEICDLRKISAVAATAVAEEAFAVGVSSIPRPPDMHKHIVDRMWSPEKTELDPSRDGIWS